ncbi:MAG: hypothetical protein IPM29_01435 [Planctomycetes bacterium]|nr:hypothetical protein [Planctomycetota bacterium]
MTPSTQHRLPRAARRPHRPVSAALLLALSLAQGCSWLPGLEDPEVVLSPRMYLYQHEGSARMQSFDSGGVVNNAAMDVSLFGQQRRDEDYGGVISIGNGFSGVELFYQRAKIDDSKHGVLTSNFGALTAGTEVNSELDYQEYRIGYVAEVFGHEFPVDDDDDVLIQLGVGGAIDHRTGDFIAYDVANPTSYQVIDFKDDGTPYLWLRGRATWRNVSFQADWSFNPDVDFGGDFEGHRHDLELLGRYTLEAQDVAFLLGYRWSDLPASASEQGLRYDTSFAVEGYVIGLEVLF